MAESTTAPASGGKPPASAIDGEQSLERAKIQGLIEQVDGLKGAVFIRNGAEHTPAEAAEHLRRKWDAAGDQIATVDEFIDNIASKSSTSGEPYRIRTKDGKEMEAGVYLRDQLEQIEQMAPKK
jgi:hypothetical protein